MPARTQDFEDGMHVRVGLQLLENLFDRYEWFGAEVQHDSITKYKFRTLYPTFHGVKMEDDLLGLYPTLHELVHVSNIDTRHCSPHLHTPLSFHI